MEPRYDRRRRRRTKAKRISFWRASFSVVALAVLISVGFRWYSDRSLASTNSGTPTKREAAAEQGRVPPLPVTTSDPATTAEGQAPNPAVPGGQSVQPLPVATTGTALQPVDLAATLDRLLADAPAHLGIVLARPDGTVLYDMNRHTQFEAASLYKLGIMVEVYRQREIGQFTFDDTITLYPGFFTEEDSFYSDAEDVYADVRMGDLLWNMITLSSNVAAQALLDFVGTGNVNNTMTNLGLTDTEIRWSPIAAAPSHTGSGTSASTSPSARWFPPATLHAVPEDAWNVTSPDDMARLFQLLLAGRVINPKVSQEMLDLLAEQGITDRFPAGLPPRARVAHKTGNLEGIVHDAGVIYSPSGPLIAVVLSDEVDDEDAVVLLMRRIAQLAYQLSP